MSDDVALAATIAGVLFGLAIYPSYRRWRERLDARIRRRVERWLGYEEPNRE